MPPTLPYLRMIVGMWRATLIDVRDLLDKEPDDLARTRVTAQIEVLDGVLAMIDGPVDR